jgi:hypothetical protein
LRGEYASPAGENFVFEYIAAGAVLRRASQLLTGLQNLDREKFGPFLVVLL